MAKVKTRYGLLDGTEERGVHAFLGVPYAKPPVGDRRWKAPEPLEKSDDVVSCKSMGYTARQVVDEVEPASLREQSEDCLTLNIWVKDLNSKNKPVMVYIHGGAFFWADHPTLSTMEPLSQEIMTLFLSLLIIA